MQIEPSRPALTQSATRYSLWKYTYPRLGRVYAGLLKPTDAVAQPNIVPLAAEEEIIPAQTDVMIKSDDLLRPVISWPTLIISCIVCLLVGSLLRSLLSDADFVIHLPARAAAPDGETWRELKRLLQWRIGRDRDLIIAIARRA